MPDYTTGSLQQLFEVSQVTAIGDSKDMSDNYLLMTLTVHNQLDLIQKQFPGYDDATLTRKCALRPCAPEQSTSQDVLL